MTSRTWPDHLLSLDEWDALPEDDGRRYELAEGVLTVSPRPVARHQRIATRLAAALDAAVRPAWCALVEVEVTVEATTPPTVRTPDVAVVREEATDQRARQTPSDVLLVVEVLSPGSRRVDRVLKVAEYAAARIPHYWIADPGPPCSLTAFELVGDAYVPRGEQRGRALLRVGDAEVPLDLDAL